MVILTLVWQEHFEREVSNLRSIFAASISGLIVFESERQLEGLVALPGKSVVGELPWWSSSSSKRH